MNRSAYNFKYCKLCGQPSATPDYPLHDACIYSCQNCDFHYLDILDDEAPTPTASQLNETSRHYIESRLDESRHLHPERLKLVGTHTHISSIVALDIGAGLGQFQLLLSEKGGKCLGIEPSNLRRQYAAETFGIELFEELAEHPSWQKKFPGYFDLITLWDVIEHVNFPRETLHAAVKLLKPGGILSLETPSRDVAPYKLSLIAHRLSRRKFSLFLPTFYSTARYGHKQIFTRKQLIKLLNEVGLEMIESRHSYTKRLAPGNKIIIVARKL